MNPALIAFGPLVCTGAIAPVKPLLPRFEPGTLRVPLKVVSHEAKVKEIVTVLRECEQVEMPVEHRFSPGIYTREIFMPADTYVIGHIHRTRHLNVVLCGKCVVMMEGKRKDIVGPCTFESGEGVQKVLYIEQDTRWMTIHANPTNEESVAKLEESLVILDNDLIARKGALTLDELRMLKTRQTLALCPSQSSE